MIGANLKSNIKKLWAGFGAPVNLVGQQKTTTEIKSRKGLTDAMVGV